MADQAGLLDFMREQSSKLLQQTLVHIGLTFSSLAIGMVVGISLGIWISFRPKWATPVLSFAGILQTIPSIALLGFMIPLLGIGPAPAIAALFLYSLLPIVRNTYTGLTGVAPDVIEAAKGMGMSTGQVMRKVQLPLAMPVIIAGIRTATVINVGVATLAAYIAAGGLGEFIFGGIALNNTNMILAGAIPAALLAVLLDWLISLVQHRSLQKTKRGFYIAFLVLLGLSGLYFLPQSRVKGLKAGFTPEFMGRKDGNLGLKQVYHLQIPTLVINDNLMYNAISEKKLDVISGSSTDGRVRAFHLSVLGDDKHIFPPYYAAPIVRKAILDQFPSLEGTLNLLSGQINDSVMTDLNYKVDFLKQSPEKVAQDFLESRNLYRSPHLSDTSARPIVIGSKIFGDGYILANMYRMLIEGYTGMRVVTKTGLGGTTICFNALVNGQIDLYPEYSGTGLLVILHASDATVDSLGGDPGKVYDYVAKGFMDQYAIRWLKPIGFNNTYALMMRQNQSDALNIHTISALSDYLQKQ
jgi:osmoprotectant transport system permease protein